MNLFAAQQRSTQKRELNWLAFFDHCRSQSKTFGLVVYDEQQVGVVHPAHPPAHLQHELLDLDEDLGDHVIVHELLHFRVPNHGNYERQEARLRANNRQIKDLN